MPLKVPIRTYRAAIQGQEANARASVALAPPSLPACSIEGQKGHGDEPAKPEDGGQWRAGPGYPGLYRPDAHRQHRAFAAGSATMGSPHESPFCLGDPVRGRFRMGLCENPFILPESASCDVFSVPQFQNGVESCPAQVF